MSTIISILKCKTKQNNKKKTSKQTTRSLHYLYMTQVIVTLINL